MAELASSGAAAAASSTTTGPPPPPITGNVALQCSAAENEVLEEYAALLANLQRLSTNITHLSDRPTAEILDGLRMLERKTSLVCTLLKASVYSIVLQQEIYGGGEDGTGDGGEIGVGGGGGGGGGEA